MGSRRAVDPGNRSAHLLVHLLVRHPEIATLRYDPRYQRLSFRFLVTRPLCNGEYARLRRRLNDSLAVYHRLTGQPQGVCQLTRRLYGGLTDLEVSRDVASLTAEEVGLLIGILQEACGESLVADDSSDAPAADPRSERIGELLAGLRQKPAASPLIALREEGRVLVFHK